MIIERNNSEHEAKLNDIEMGVKNKWRWEWLLSVVELDPAKKYPKLNWTYGQLKMVVKDHIRKIDVAGTAWCSICSSNIVYSEAGLKNLKQHLGYKKHVKNLGSVMSTQQLLPGTSMPEAANVMYGAPAAYSSAASTTTTTTTTSDIPQVHILDRVANMEAMIVSFLAEHSLSFTLSEGLIELAQELSKDTPALKKLKLHRTTASYKVTWGLSFIWKNELIEKLQVTPFSLNMDESTSTNSMHVYTVLVCYYNSDTKNIAVEHLGSMDVPSCTSDNLYNETLKLFSHYNLPWKKLLAMLSDSASTMRGKVTGLETQIRDTVANHLLDIDGESCHHVHNIVKKLTSFFDYFLENLFRDISNEFKFCVDSLAVLKEMTFHMGKKFRKPITFHACRWLSVYDACVEFGGMVDVHRVFFSAFKKADIKAKLNVCNRELKNIGSGKVSSSSKSKKELEEEKSKLPQMEKSRKKKKERVLKEVSQESRNALDELEDKLVGKFKTGTEKGKKRKHRIISSLLGQPNRYTLLSSFYQTILPIFKSYVLLFQSDKPLIHKVYHKQVSLVKEFFSYFIKPDALERCKKGEHLLKLDIKKNTLPNDLMFIGSKAKKLIAKLEKDHVDVTYFMERVQKTYVECGEYIQTKLPLENEVLKAFTSIDPLLVCSPNKIVLKRLLSLPTLLPTVLEEDEEDVFEKQARAVCVDGNLPKPLDVELNEVDCLEWWNKISDRYSIIFKMVCAVLSIFHGPRVESTFSIMGNVIDQNSGRMNMETYGAIQDIKYGLKSRLPTRDNRSVKVFSRNDRLFSPVDPRLSKAMRNSFNVYRQKQHEKKEEENKRKQKFDVTIDQTTAKKLKLNSVAVADKAREKHHKILQKAYKPIVSPSSTSVTSSTSTSANAATFEAQSVEEQYVIPNRKRKNNSNSSATSTSVASPSSTTSTSASASTFEAQSVKEQSVTPAKKIKNKSNSSKVQSTLNSFFSR